MNTGAARQKSSLRRMLLALDALHCESALMDRAAAIAAKIEADMDALFLEEDELYAVADLPITQEISLSSARQRNISSRNVEQAWRSLSRDAEARFGEAMRRARLKGQFRIERAPRGQALRDAVDHVDVLLLQPGDRTIVRVRMRTSVVPRVFALCGSSPASLRTLDLAARLARQDHHALELISLGEPSPERITELESRGVEVHTQAEPPESGLSVLLQKIENRPGNILLVPADLPLDVDRTQMLEQLSQLRCQVLLIN